MDIYIYILIILIGISTIFIIVEQPYYFVGLVIFLTVYRFNLETPLPLDLRGIFTIIIFIRLYLFDKENARLVNSYLFRYKNFWIIFGFITISLVLPILHSEKLFSLLREIIINLILIIVGFLVLIDNKGKKVFLFSILLVGIVSSIDLFYTYIIGGGLNVVRVLSVLTGRDVLPMNHNFPGMLSSLALIFLYLLYLRKEIQKLLAILLFIVLLAGIFLSTSRSALFAVIFVFITIHFFEPDLKVNLKRIVKIGIQIFATIILFIILYNFFLQSKAKNHFFDKVYYRLIDEPLETVGLSHTMRFNEYSENQKKGSIEFREEKWKKDLNKYMNLTLLVKLFGLGANNYLEIAEIDWGNWDNIKGRYLAHNGYLIILVERGVLGLILYLLIILFLAMDSYKINRQFLVKTPVIYLFIFMVIFGIGQNNELTISFIYLFMGGTLGNIHSCKSSNIVSNK